MLNNSVVSVDATPNGRADAISDDSKYFVLPEERKMKFPDFVKLFSNREKHEVLYLQHQNSSFTTEFSILSKDIDLEIDFAREAFAAKPDNVNFWLGENRSITTCHKDPYENLYAVICGEKRMTLMHPANYPFLYERNFPQARYFRKDASVDSPDSWQIIPLEPEAKVPWIS